MRRALLAAFIVVVTLASSQEPLTGPSAKSKPTRQATEQNGRSHQGERQTREETELTPVRSVARQQREGSVLEDQGASEEGLTRFLAWAAILIAAASAAASAFQAYAAAIAAQNAKANLDLTRQAVNAAQESVTLTKRALEDSQESGKQNLALTKQVADAATKSTDLAEISLSLYERPWVTFLAPVIQHRHIPASSDIGGLRGTSASPVYPRLTNSGKSPAIMLSVGVPMIVGNDLPPPESLVGELLGNENPGVLTPGAEYNLLPLQLEYQTDQEERVFIVTAAEYVDLLGKRHRSVSVWGLETSTARFFPVRAPEFHQYT